MLKKKKKKTPAIIETAEEDGEIEKQERQRFLTCSRSLSSPITAPVFQLMTSEKGSSQPLLSMTGTQAAYVHKHKHTHKQKGHSSASFMVHLH